MVKKKCFAEILPRKRFRLRVLRDLIDCYVGPMKNPSRKLCNEGAFVITMLEMELERMRRVDRGVANK